MELLNNNRGQSLLEVIVAMAIFALISSAMVSLSLGGLSALEQGGEQTQAEALAQEGVEAVRAIRDSAWNKLVYATSSVEINGNEWEFTGEDTTEIIDQYTRTISFFDICRDGGDNIVACPGIYIDLHSKKAIVTVDWEIRPGVNNSVQKITYLTNWDSINWTQTDWAGGAGQSTWFDTTRYDSDDSNLDYGDSGEIKLASLGGGGCGAKVWSFVSSSDYTFDSEKIEVTGGMAQLFSSGGGGIDGFTQGVWHLDEASGDLIDVSVNGNDLSNVKGSPQYSQSGKFNTSLDFNANSSRYINHGSQTGLNFTESFTIEAWIYREAVATTYESTVSKWRENGNKKSYALVVNPSNKLELWVSSNGSDETVLTAVNTLPIGSWVHISATYDGSNLYIFQNGVLENQISYSSGIADEASFFSISGADKFNGGDAFFDGKIDEVRISNTARWTGSFTPPTSAYGPASYPTDIPSINPNTSDTVTAIDTWSSFTETANKNGGEIYYQLSDDDGISWKYWDGLDWGVAGDSNYNTAVDVNTNISTFSTTTGQIMFKAFLESDGDQLVQLDEVEISCSQSYEWPFTTALNYIYDNEKIEISAGSARLISSGGGGLDGLGDSTIDSLEFDDSDSDRSSIVQVTGNIYAIAYNGPGTDGWVKTVYIDSSGDIADSTIDSLEYDTSDSKYPSIIKIDDDTFAVVYQGSGNDGWLKTFNIDGSGNISNSVIDSLEFDTSNGLEPVIIHISGSVYGIVYRGSGSDGWLKTVTIETNGSIGNSVIDSYEWDTSNGRQPDILAVGGNVYAIVYQGPGADGWLKTVAISSGGVITKSVIDSLEFDTSDGAFPHLTLVNGNIYAIVYQGSGNDGWLKTVSIDGSGNIGNSIIDSFEFDTNKGKEPRMIGIGDGNFIIVYENDDSHGEAVLLSIADNGTINSVIDTMIFDDSSGQQPFIIETADDIFAISYNGPGGDGWLVTIGLSIASDAYPTDNPPIYPTATFSVSTSSLEAWNSFTEVATKNGGEIYYQLSDDTGSTWQYWDGGSWSVAGGGDYNTAVDVNTNISTFSTSTGQIMFKAFLESDGIEQVELDGVTVAWGEGEGEGGGGFATFGYLVSSAYNMSNVSPVQILEWDEDVSGCNPTCDVRLQLRVAPDSGGSPGAWTGWSGSSGVGTYFTNPLGTLISTDLNDNQWVQYRAELNGDGMTSPVLQEVKVNYK